MQCDKYNVIYKIQLQFQFNVRSMICVIITMQSAKYIVMCIPCPAFFLQPGTPSTAENKRQMETYININSHFPYNLKKCEDSFLNYWGV